jgi:hypothetical protein
MLSAGVILADAVTAGESSGGIGVDTGRPGIEGNSFEDPRVEPMEPVERIAAFVAQFLGKSCDPLVGAGEQGHAAEQRWRQRLRGARDDAPAILGQHFTGEGDVDAVDRAVDIKHRRDVAEAIAPGPQPRVAIDVDPPVGNAVAGEARRGDPQQLDDAALRLRPAVARRMMDEQPHRVSRTGTGWRWPDPSPHSR